VTPLVFSVLGRPAPQGSKQPIIAGNGRLRTVEQSKRVKPYRDSVVVAAREALDEHAAPETFYEAPVGLTVTFLFQRPKSHLRTAAAFQHEPSGRAPSRPVSRQTGDVEKLVRAVNDALSAAGVIRDDAQVVQLTASKRYAAPGAPEQTIIELSALPRTVADAETWAAAA
jgi:Holliday junction resolvase RusA-like endonuclease